jgi:hypothetical protein
MKKSLLPRKAIKKLLEDIKDLESESFNEAAHKERYGSSCTQPTLKFSLLFRDNLSSDEAAETEKTDIANVF